MSLVDIVLLLLAGVAAGTINAVVGSGSLITFPTLLALGYPPVLANVTNNIGVLPGSVSGAYAYRRELRGHGREVVVLAVFSALGGLVGALLLLVLPAAAFNAIVPVLIILACVLVVVSPWLKRRLAGRRALSEVAGGATRVVSTRTRVGLTTGTALTGVYGGYFGAAQGVLLLSLLTFLVRGGIQQANAYKNVLAATANGAAAVVFVFATPVSWPAALVIAVGSVIGGQIGGTIGHRLPSVVYRIVILAVGVAAVVYFYVH